jgi:hypothetical protein
MGLLDFFSRRGGQDEPSGNEARNDHYTFPHTVLREAAFADPTECVTTLASADAADYVTKLFEEVIQACQEFEFPVTMTPDDVLIHKLRIGPFPCTLIEMPTPNYPTEVFFVALVLTVDVTSREKQAPETSLRFITLEHGEVVDTQRDEIPTVLGEWMADESYVSHGEGPKPTIDEFVRSVNELVANKRLA